MSDIDGYSAEAEGVEAETEDPSLAISRPYNPELIKVMTSPALVSLIVTRIDENEIDLAPEFQRRARVWDNGRKSRLIESLLLRIPLPVFYVAADAKDRWSVVDGLQRLTTIFDFVKGEFHLSGLEYLAELDNKLFADLPRQFQRRINETSLVVHVIQDGTPEEVMINIFKRINTGGLSLTAQEVRNALAKEPARDFLQALAGSDEFRLATSGSVKDDRMDAQECVLRFMAFYIRDWRKYGTDNGSLDLLLNQTMRELSAISAERRAALAKRFRDTMLVAEKLFGDDAFRKRYEKDGRRKPVSKALFEAWSVNLASRTPAECEQLVRRKVRLINGFIDLMNSDSDFDIAVSASTGSPNRVAKRFGAIEALIARVLE
jgi:Protein of unknown function DUF262